MFSTWALSNAIAYKCHLDRLLGLKGEKKKAREDKY
jgi:hypothetical protein